MGPDENADLTRETPSPDNQSFTYDNPEQAPYEAGYEPEREFVLMPLFRRIGEIFGIGRKEAPEYIYTPEPVPGETRARVAAEPEPPRVADAPTEMFESVAPEPVEGREADDVLGIEPELAAEPVTLQSQTYFQPQPEPAISVSPRELEERKWEEIAAPNVPVAEYSAVAPQEEREPESAAILQEQPEPRVVFSQSSNDLHAPVEAVAASQFEPTAYEPTPPAVMQPAPPVVVRGEASRPQQAQRALTQEDIKELIAPIRDAAVSISAAISQAAEWLHNKEEEILRRAETLSAQASEQRKRGLQLVEQPRLVPFWKRIEWDKEFTPLRAAILGAVVMAVLMVLGISLARRPASSALPQQTHTIEPGGVTLTTHPAATTASPLTVQHRSTPSVRSSAPTTHRTQRSANDDYGPDVVTHYYGNKAKPSPAHQSTIAGVRHYSDMQ